MISLPIACWDSVEVFIAIILMTKRGNAVSCFALGSSFEVDCANEVGGVATDMGFPLQICSASHARISVRIKYSKNI